MTTETRYYDRKTNKLICDDSIVMDEKRGLVCMCHNLVVMKNRRKA